MARSALITGITGQDGSYMAELLLEKGYKVYGVVRRGSTVNTSRIDHLLCPIENLTLLYGDLTNGIDSILGDIKPDLVFNLAAMSYVFASFSIPVYTVDTNAVGPTRILEAIRTLGLKNTTRFYQASSSEMFGMSQPPQNELTAFQPASPYGISKLAAYWMTQRYRDAYKMFATTGILFNHESKRRGETFVTKKIVRAAVRIKLGKQKDLCLGNIKSKRDWGHSRDYVNAIYKIIMHTEPDVFVVATGQQHTVQEFVESVFEKLGLDWQEYVKISEQHFRPVDVPDLLGDASKIRRVLGWEPSITFDQLIQEMIDSVMREESNEHN